MPEFECIDPPMGERIFELSRPGGDPKDRTVLEAHLKACAFCRQAVDLDQRIADRLRDRRPRRVRRGRPFWLGSASLATAAAAAICMMMMTPRPMGPSLSIRGTEGAQFVRPVEGEVVLSKGLSANWTEVPDAASYTVRLSDLDGQSSWTSETEAPHWSSDGDVELVPGRTYRLVLSTKPEDLLAPGAVSVRFVAGTVPSLVAHRVTNAQPIAYGLLMSAFAFGIYALSARKKRA
jgi:hypothetical protein